MFLHIGNNLMIRTDQIIAILDLETTGESPINDDFLTQQKKEGKLKNLEAKKIEKTLVLTQSSSYLSPISSNTLLKRYQLKAQYNKF